MLERAVPEWLRHPPTGVARTPSARAFAALSGIEALIRGTLLSVLPLALYSHLGGLAWWRLDADARGSAHHSSQTASDRMQPSERPDQVRAAVCWVGLWLGRRRAGEVC